MSSYLFVNGVEIYKFKAKDFKINSYPMCLGNISKDFSNDDMEKAGIHGYVYDFSIDYGSIGVDNILNIHQYLMQKHDIE